MKIFCAAALGGFYFLAAAENAFAQESVAHGMRTAFSRTLG